MTADIRIILDRSALLAFSRGAFGVGETIVEVVDGGGYFAIPVTVFADTLSELDAHAETLVRMLAGNTDCVVLPVLAEDGDAIAEWTRRLDDIGLAVCVVEALARKGCYVLTGEPGAYGQQLNDEGLIIAI